MYFASSFVPDHFMFLIETLGKFSFLTKVFCWDWQKYHKNLIKIMKIQENLLFLEKYFICKRSIQWKLVGNLPYMLLPTEPILKLSFLGCCNLKRQLQKNVDLKCWMQMFAIYFETAQMAWIIFRIIFGFRLQAKVKSKFKKTSER